jgi:hypothetical protein
METLNCSDVHERLFLDSMPFLKPNEADDIYDKERVLGYLTSPAGENVGWLPLNSCPGDALCIVGGAPRPFVVRAARDGSCQLLGDAFTLKGTLKTALGGRDDATHMDTFGRRGIDWNECQDKEMVQLIKNIGWATLS